MNSEMRNGAAPKTSHHRTISSRVKQIPYWNPVQAVVEGCAPEVCGVNNGVYFVCIIKSSERLRVNSRDIIRSLQQDGWFEVAHVGSHKQFKHPVKPGRVTVPTPKRDIPPGTVRSIEKQARLRLR